MMNRRDFLVSSSLALTAALPLSGFSSPMVLEKEPKYNYFNNHDWLLIEECYSDRLINFIEKYNNRDKWPSTKEDEYCIVHCKAVGTNTVFDPYDGFQLTSDNIIRRYKDLVGKPVFKKPPYSVGSGDSYGLIVGGEVYENARTHEFAAFYDILFDAHRYPDLARALERMSFDISLAIRIRNFDTHKHLKIKKYTNREMNDKIEKLIELQFVCDGVDPTNRTLGISSLQHYLKNIEEGEEKQYV